MFPRRDLAWSYWLATVMLLASGLAGWAPGLYGAILLCGIQVVHFAWREGSWTAFPVQVRFAYASLLLLGLWGPLGWVHWIQLIGTTARVTVGYCLLSRTLSLLPWNRCEPMSADLLSRTFFMMRGGITCTTYRRPAWVVEG